MKCAVVASRNARGVFTKVPAVKHRSISTQESLTSESLGLQTDPLFEPFQLKGLRLRNRILSTSHAPNYVVDGLPQERYRKYHEAKAQGGIGLTMIGGSSCVSRDSPSAFGQINLATDAVVPHLQEVSSAVHGHGAAIMLQLTHMGRRTWWNVSDWLPVIAPSRLREEAHKSYPKAMDIFDIKRVVGDFGDAARRCQLGGLDGVELLASGHLLDSFWSPLTNSRSDEYGGSLANRIRFCMEVLEDIRAKVGTDFIVGIRMIGKAANSPASPGWEVPGAEHGDLTHDECLEIGKLLADSGMVDFFNFNVGQIDTDNKLASQIPSMYGPLAPNLDVAASFRKELGMPIFHACRVIDLTTARRAIAEDAVDMIGMTRAQIADPNLAHKAKQGLEAQIRPCVGAGYCLDRIYKGLDALCLHNPATGREYIGMPHSIAKADKSLNACVIGGGVAGLEAARVLAMRGHKVVLFEVAQHLGGQIRVAQRATWRRDLGGIADYLEQEVGRLQVDVRLSTEATLETVQSLAPDIVIYAAGGIPDDLGLQHVVSTWEVLGGEVSVGPRVLIFDSHGGFQAPSCAEAAAKNGDAVELVTSDRMVGEGMGALNWPIFLRNLYKYGVKLTPDHRLVSVEQVAQDGGSTHLKALLCNPYSGSVEERVVDTVIVENGTVPLEDVFEDLRPHSTNHGEIDLDALVSGRPQSLCKNSSGAFQLFRVGDAVSSRDVHAAIYDSLRLCKDL